MMTTVMLTPELVAEEAADAMGYVDEQAAADALAVRTGRVLEALRLLPEGYYVERADYMLMERKVGHRFTAFAPDDTVVTDAIRWRRRGGEQVINLGATHGGADEVEATCKAVCLLLAAIDYEAHARTPEVTR
jgi:hypothetical protein